MSAIRKNVMGFAAGLGFAVAAFSGTTAHAQATTANEARVSPGTDTQNTTTLNVFNVFQKQGDLQLLDREDPKNRDYAGAIVMASCVIRRSKGNAGDFFGGPLTDDPQYAGLSEVLTKKYRNCLVDGANGVSMYLVNAALAEQLLRSDEFRIAEGPVSADFYLDGGKITSLEGLSRCLAAHSPVLVQAYLRAMPGSDEAKSKLATVYASTPQCGVTKPIAIAEVDQRAVLATSLYQWNQNKK